MSSKRQSPLPRLAVRFACDICPTLSSSDQDLLHQVIADYTNGSKDYESAKSIFESLVQDSSPVDRIRDILAVGPEPLPPCPTTRGDGHRQKTRSWSNIEDLRLLAGIHREGMDNWSAIARFVGNARTRSQCSQRWIRGLDPRISRLPWTAEEDKALLRFVGRYGEKSWIAVSQGMGRRSDVQCRYRHRQLQKEPSPAAQAPNPPPEFDLPAFPDEPLELTRFLSSEFGSSTFFQFL
jgi:hypothetical protein